MLCMVCLKKEFYLHSWHAHHACFGGLLVSFEGAFFYSMKRMQWLALYNDQHSGVLSFNLGRIIDLLGAWQVSAL